MANKTDPSNGNRFLTLKIKQLRVYFINKYLPMISIVTDTQLMFSFDGLKSIISQSITMTMLKLGSNLQFTVPIVYIKYSYM